jgi:hypothetical protein
MYFWELFAVSLSLNINMNWSTFSKPLLYAAITFVIGVISQLDALDFKFEIITSSQWVGIMLKSILPGLVSVKALFDTHETSTSNNIQQS